jgi:hypothetical protein
MQVILAIIVGAALILAAVAHIRGWRENMEPVQLGIGGKLRPYEFRNKRRRS